MRTGLLFAAAVAVAAIYALATPTMAWSSIDINDPGFQEIARWAVTEHVKQANDRLKFNKLVSGEIAIAGGYTYSLIIDASNGDGKDGKYEAVVKQRELGGILSLVSFDPAE